MESSMIAGIKSIVTDFQHHLPITWRLFHQIVSRPEKFQICEGPSPSLSEHKEDSFSIFFIYYSMQDKSLFYCSWITSGIPSLALASVRSFSKNFSVRLFPAISWIKRVSANLRNWHRLRFYITILTKVASQFKHLWYYVTFVSNFHQKTPFLFHFLCACW